MAQKIETESDTRPFFKTGQRLIIPPDADIQFSSNAVKFPSTPVIVNIFVDKVNLSIKFFPSNKIFKGTRWKRAGLFLHKDTRPGDTVELLWTTPTCAESRLCF